VSLNTTASTWVAGTVVSAAQLNLEIRDAINGLQSAWTAYTPTLTGITLGNGTLTFAFNRVGKTITVRGNFVAGSTTTYSAATLGFSMPVAPHASYTATGAAAVGPAWISPTGAARTGGIAFIPVTAVFNFLCGTPANSIVTNLVPATWGTTSVLTFTATYEAA
jgi:hypothetical protein